MGNKYTVGKPATNVAQTKLNSLNKDVQQKNAQLATWGAVNQLAAGANAPFVGGSIYVPTPIIPKNSSTTSIAKKIAQDQKQANQLKPLANPRGIVGNLPTNVKYNLPPHDWSLPLDQSLLNGGRDPQPISASNPFFKNLDGSNPKGSYHGLRRSVMWFFGDGKSLTSDGLTIPAGDTLTNTYNSTDSSGNQTSQPYDQATSNPTDNNWGFQFLWNPTTISSTVSRNSNVVPSPTDKFNGIAGIFTAQEQIQFTIVLDRINDFACGKAVGNPA